MSTNEECIVNVPEKHRKVAHAWVDGALVQYKSAYSEEWIYAEVPAWLVGNEYRIKPEPAVEERKVDMGLKVTLYDSHLDIEYTGVFVQIGANEYKIIGMQYFNRHSDRSYRYQEIVKVGDKVDDLLCIGAFPE